MESLIAHLRTANAPTPQQLATPILPAWVSSTQRTDPIENFLISHRRDAELTAFAQDSTRSLVWVEGQPHFNELLLVPIVTTGHVALADDPQIWQAVQDPLVQQLVRMFPKDWSMGFFKGVVPVEDLLGMPWQTGWSDCQVDGQRLSQDIARAVESLNQDGYEVVSISPVTSGVYFYQYNDQDITSAPRILMETEKVSGGGSYGFGYGFSYTEGVTVIAKRVA